ncbi:hypothetical protein [Aestuariicoccus sp. MJ-SS9]|uniref:hypothetical protein n=1 Tax=Aestuariicoccus sp. MJ-SS9 TaxID=3079855 RepID=UPI00290AEE98|nr:hypothetical protein [Aestuariicoccus sp. MJ-SS9]MDU8913778.1 hypothetical protein [Aestuariicoccus sp. MJ-SS9]
MVSSSKILTVSYGTFSCTAEGFEDPLAAVKDATRFYQGIVREDRFFGSEPPQLDAEMAEQMMAQQIGAEYGADGLVLRPALGAPAASSDALAAALAAGPSRVPSKPAETTETTEARHVDEADDRDVPTDDAVGVIDTADLSAPVAVLSEEEALGDNAPDDFADVGFDSMALKEEEPPQADAEEAGAAELMDEDAYEEETGVEIDLSILRESAAADEVAAPEETVAAPPAPAPAGSTESVAAKLQRIRAVVSRGQAAGAPASDIGDDGYSEDEPEDSTGDDAFDATGIAGVLEGMSDTGFAEQDDEFDDDGFDDEDAPETLGENLFTDTIAGLARDSAETLSGEDHSEEDDLPEDTSTAPERPPLRRTRVVKVKRAELEAVIAPDPLEPFEDEDDGTSSSLSPEEEEELARELAAVEAELDADDWDDDEDDWPDLVPAALSEADEDEDDAAPAPLRLRNRVVPFEPAEEAREPQTGTSVRDMDEDAFDDDDFEDDLDAERALEIDADDLEDNDEGDDTIDPAVIERLAQEGARKAVKLSSPARVMLTENRIGADDNSVSRILDETNTQMEEPEGNRRRSAIAHLRAAVAATRADRLLGRKKDPEEEFEPYREDLANVVRPRRPKPTAEARSERPQTETRPAPLKLVAEQRVDDHGPALASVPVRPRRIRRDDLDDSVAAEEEADTGFAAFAEDMGATDLPELLEAAAAYMAFVEGRDQFSRPQLMTKVRQAELTESSREDRLRSFGQLLREGKIEKTRGGRFTASETISFRPGARAAG